MLKFILQTILQEESRFFR